MRSAEVTGARHPAVAEWPAPLPVLLAAAAAAAAVTEVWQPCQQRKPRRQHSLSLILP